MQLYDSVHCTFLMMNFIIQEARRKLEEEENEMTDEEDIEEDEEVKEKEEKNVAVDNLFYDVCKNENELEKKN